MEALGGLVGCGDDDFNLWLRGYIDSLQPYLDMLLHPELPVQITMLLLRLSAIPKIGYLTRVTPPRLLEAHVKRFDNMVLNTFLQKCALPNSLSNAAKFTISLPVRLGGLGLRPAATTSIPAYYCSVALAASDIFELIIPVARRMELIPPGKSQAPFITDAGIIFLSEVLPRDLMASSPSIRMNSGKKVVVL
jgi:hypothetical protein